MQAWLGLRTSADINVVAQILILVGLWVGAYFARMHRIRTHQSVQTTLVIAESFLILLVMITSFYGYVVAGSNNSRNDAYPRSIEAADAMMRDASRRFSLDLRRLYVTGFSGGARVRGSRRSR